MDDLKLRLAMKLKWYTRELDQWGLTRTEKDALVFKLWAVQSALVTLALRTSVR